MLVDCCCHGCPTALKLIVITGAMMIIEQGIESGIIVVDIIINSAVTIGMLSITMIVFLIVLSRYSFC